jgi:integrase
LNPPDTKSVETSGTGKLIDRVVRKLPAPATGNRITYDRGDDAVRGFGVRITAGGARSFILNYVASGRERRLTIGAYPDWTVVAAREEAKRLKREVDLGRDPLGERVACRESPTVNELCDRYLAEHAARKRGEPEDRRMIERAVRPQLGSRKVAEITFTDIDRLHRKLTNTRERKKTGAPYAANRVLALLSKMFNLSIRWGMRSDNPAKGVERNPEDRRVRYLSGDELRRLMDALTTHSSQSAANAVRLLLLTGARRGEVLSATWDQFDLEAGIWTKPSSHTKQKREHRVPLSAPTRQLLAEMRGATGRGAAEQRRDSSPYLFPARLSDGPMVELKSSWAAICRTADLQGLRLHDLRHSFASVLASAGLSLPVIGALLGHTQPGTTARYAHLFDDPLRAAAERVGALVTGNGDRKSPADIAEIGRRR